MYQQWSDRNKNIKVLNAVVHDEDKFLEFGSPLENEIDPLE